MNKEDMTREQREVVEHRGSNLLVSASAGSGKTTVMIERIIELLEQGQSLENMAVCTFTNAAADDMKSKLSRKMSERNSPEIVKQLKLLPQAEITTLDSWCSHIIKTYFYACDIDPNFEILDTTQADIALAEFTEEVIGEFIDAGQENFIKLYDALSSNRHHKALARLIGELYDYAAVMPDPTAWLNGARVKKVSHEQHLSYIMEEYYRRRDKLINKLETHRYEILAAGFSDDAATIQNLIDHLSFDGVEMQKLKPLKKTSPFCYLHDATKALKAEVEKTSARLGFIRSLRDEGETVGYVDVLVSLTLLLGEKYAAYKKKNAYADYSDLEHETLKILSSEYLPLAQEKYKLVFVDEYQDINPLQEAILAKFSGRMFFVGDVKQSIYGFRLCAPKFFLEKRNKYISNDGGHEIELNANFRSDDKILQLVNDVFSRVMTEELGDVDYKNTARFEQGKQLYSPAVVVKLLKKSKREKLEIEPKVYSVLSHENVRQDTDMAREVSLVAEHIAQLLQTTIDDGNGSARPVGYGDIVVLVRARDKFSYELSEALARLTIPVSFMAQDAALSHKPIELLVSLMRLLNNRDDDISLASVMRSYFGGFSDDELSVIRLQTDSELFFYEAVASFSEKSGALQDRVKAFLAWLDEYAALSYGVKVDELMGKITAASDYFNYVLLNYGEAECDALAVFMNGLSETKNNLTLCEYLNFFDKVELPLQLEGDADSIRIMTIHASKGLEFPFVIMPNIDKKISMRDTYGDMLLSSDGVSLKYYNWDTRVKEFTAEFEHTKMEITKKCLSEEMRVLYVAMTRAKLQLSLFGICDETEADGENDKDAVSYYDWLRPSILPIAEFIDCDVDCDMGEAGNKFIFSTPNADIAKKISDRVNFTYGGEHKILKTNVSRILADNNAEEKITYIGGGESDDRAAQRGSAYHKAMEVIDFYKPFDEQWESLARQYPCVLLCDKQKIERAAKKIKSATVGAKFYREQPFVLSSEQESGVVLVQGVIDLLIIRGNSADIVDYKTSPIMVLEQGKYRAQMDMYAKAAEKILGVSVNKKLLYSFDKDDFIVSD